MRQGRVIMKNKRHDAIVDIIQHMDIYTQEELQKELQKRGFSVTQATVSRDIRRLRLSKRQMADGKNIYAVPMAQGSQEHDRLLRVLRDSVRGMDSAQNILVIKTGAGMAMAAAAAIDSLSIAGIIGCIAGDDTILAVLKTPEAAEEACERLRLDLE